MFSALKKALLSFFVVKNGNGADKSVPFLTLLSFVLTFFISRLITVLFPGFSLNVEGIHVHHFAYGILLLALLGLILLNSQPSYYDRLRLSVLYGIALGLAFDEFAMWLELDNIYHDRRSLNAVVAVASFLLSFLYFDGFWRKWGSRLDRLGQVIFIRGPLALFRLIKKMFRS